MTGKYRNGCILHDNPYTKYNNIANEYYNSIKLLYGVGYMGDEYLDPAPDKYEIHNPKNVELIEDGDYEFEVIYFDDGNIAEIIAKT